MAAAPVGDLPGRASPAATGPSDGAGVQTAIAGTRARLLGGRGPGASTAQIDRHTRARTQLAGEPIARHLEAVARQTAMARGDAAAIALHVAAEGDRLALDVRAIRDEVRSLGVRVAIGIATTVAVVGATVVVLRAVLRRSTRPDREGQVRRL